MASLSDCNCGISRDRSGSIRCRRCTSEGLWVNASWCRLCDSLCVELGCHARGNHQMEGSHPGKCWGRHRFQHPLSAGPKQVRSYQPGKPRATSDQKDPWLVRKDKRFLWGHAVLSQRKQKYLRDLPNLTRYSFPYQDEVNRRGLMKSSTSKPANNANDKKVVLENKPPAQKEKKKCCWLICKTLGIVRADQRVDVKSLDREVGDSNRDRVGERTSTRVLNSPFVARNSFLFWDWMSLLTFACLCTNFASAFSFSNYISHLPDSILFSRALV